MASIFPKTILQIISESLCYISRADREEEDGALREFGSHPHHWLQSFMHNNHVVRTCHSLADISKTSSPASGPTSNLYYSLATRNLPQFSARSQLNFWSDSFFLVACVERICWKVQWSQTQSKLILQKVVHVFSQGNVIIFSQFFLWKPLELNNLHSLRAVSYLPYLCLASIPGLVLQMTFELNSVRNVQPAYTSNRTVTDNCGIILFHIGTDISACICHPLE